MAAPTTEPSQSLQPNVFKGVSVKSIIKKIANINIPNAKHPQNVCKDLITFSGICSYKSSLLMLCIFINKLLHV